MSMTPAQEAAAMWGSAENLAYPVDQRLACALKALTFYGSEPLRFTTAKGEGEPRDGVLLITIWPDQDTGEVATRLDGRWFAPRELRRAD